MEKIEDVVCTYVEESGLSLREFAQELTESIKLELSHSAVLTWKTGKSEPATDFLLQCVIAYGDWRRQFALDVLRAKVPEVFVDHLDEFCQAFQDNH